MNPALQDKNTQPTPPVSTAALNDILQKTKEVLGRETASEPSVNVSPANVGAVPQSNVSVRGISNLLDALLARSIITNEQYNAFKFEAVNSNKTIDQVLIEHSTITFKELAKTYAEMRGVGYIDVADAVINLEVLNKLPADIAKSSQAVVFEDLPVKVKVAMKDPLDLQKIKYLESIIGKKIEPYYAAEDEIDNVINTKYGAQIGNDVNQALEEVGDNLIDINKSYQDANVSTDNENAPIIRIVNMILEYGVKNKASDIHIEPREKMVVVRFRVRGLLTEGLTIPKTLLNSVIARIKILSDLKIDEKRVPQDGRFQIKTEDQIVDVRVSIMPSIYGEKIVMRLLAKNESALSLEELGMRGIAFARFKEALKKTQGVILVTGPTGSGKTQTLSSALKILNNVGVNIMTLEDPVEIRVEGVNQVQVNAEVGLTFASGLRSFLRQDPDIIMVGEIRDSETASLAIQSALVGRLVLSTVHTNSSGGAFIRLLDMGIEPFLLSSTVNLVIGQRLVRVLCTNCKQSFEATPEMLGEMHKELDKLNEFNIYTPEHELKLHFDKNTNKVILYKAVGCPKCNNTGYTSRTGIFEALKMSDTISQAIVKKSTIKEINDIAISEGMITMIQDGFLKAIEGVTTLEEVLRVKNE
ncbi:MAG: ATPase, T2SS/T4P/T4SS family [Candidatus Dojkabacteria bacterium]